jgi:hypothetical protein
MSACEAYRSTELSLQNITTITATESYRSYYSVNVEVVE